MMSQNFIVCDRGQIPPPDRRPATRLLGDRSSSRLGVTAGGVEE
jgi:hypothetical protein